MTKRICSYCNKPLRKQYWFNPFACNDNYQCDRFWCRVRTGHILFNTKYKFKSITLSIPYIGRKKRNKLC